MWRRLAFTIGLLVLLCSSLLRAQDEQVSLGDLARTVRAEKPKTDPPVIDNDNLAIMMNRAEAERLNGKPVFSIDPSGKTFRMTSPDGSCSLSFDANATALIATPYVTSNLPQDSLTRLNGSAAIHGNTMEVTLQNTTDWEVKEIVVGLTLLNSEGATFLRPANLLLPEEVATKSPDTTMLYHLKATALPGGSAVFRGTLDQEVASGTDWHWALVGARGIPPAAPGSVAAAATAQQAAPTQSAAPATQPAAVPASPVQNPAAVPDAGKSATPDAGAGQ